MDGIAIVLDLHHPDHYLHAFTFPEWRHVASFGKRGKGPEEMLSAESIRFHALDSLWVLDANRMLITRWQISPQNRLAERVEAIDLDKSLIRTLDFLVTDTGFIVPDYLGTHRYSRVTFQGKRTGSEGSIPTEKGYNELARPAFAQAWRSFIDGYRGSDILVMATQLGEVIEFHRPADSEGAVLYGPHGEPEFRPEQSEAIPTGIMGFSDVQVTERYVYAVFHGRSFEEIGRTLRAGGVNEDGGRFIYVFDHEGTPVRKYTLDRAVYGIHVDEQAGTIVATDVNSDNPICVFEM